jgi:cytochrome b involved in lipid metabolism
MQRWFTPADVAQHNSASDCWVSFLGKVFDLTSLIHENGANGL